MSDERVFYCTTGEPPKCQEVGEDRIERTERKTGASEAGATGQRGPLGVATTGGLDA